MSTDKNKKVIKKIIAHIDNTLEYVNGQTIDSFTQNRMLQEACVFNVLQIGELAKNALDADIAVKYPEIPWKQMYGMRNRLVHDYDGIRLKTVWLTIIEDFPKLKKALMKITDDL